MITVDLLCPLQFFFIMIGGYIAIVVDVSEVVTFFFSLFFLIVIVVGIVIRVMVKCKSIEFVCLSQ